ncbi:MAG: T9SS type A sorting domain-containing protein [Saprospiraceae bacterium]
MKRLSFNRTLLLSIFMTFFAMNGFCQVLPSCWDFEEGCSDPSNSFFLGCIANAQSASGTPDNAGSPFVPPFAGSKYAHMYANYCFTEPSNPNTFHAEGIILQGNFIAGVPVKITFAARGLPSPNELKVILVNNMPNIGGPGGEPGCQNTLDILPEIPANSETMLTLAGAAIPNNAWGTFTINWTPSSNFNQIWFRPKATSPAPNGEAFTHLYLDKVCVEDPCQTPTYSTSVCLYPGSSNVVVSINGGAVLQNQWRLFKAISCTGGTGSANLGPQVPISWLSNTSFTLPWRSDCYLLVFSPGNPPGCPPQADQVFLINTRNGVGVCQGPCDDWVLDLSMEPCQIAYFSVLPTGSSGLQSATTFTFKLDGTEVQTGSVSDYTILLMGPNGLANGSHTMCVTVYQTGCPPIEQCVSFDIKCFQGPGSDRDSVRKKEGTALRISNPSSGYIWMSQSLEHATANLYSIQGAMLKSFALNGTDRLDVSDIVTGQYVLTVQGQDFFLSKFVLIQNQN